MSINQQEFTTVGRTMLGRAQNAETLNISKIVVGSGSAAQASDLYPLTALITHQLDVVITAKNDDGNGTLTVEGSFNSTAAAALFELRELGVMANVAGETDQLYSVANVLTDIPEIIDPASISIHAFKIKLVIDRATNVTITIGTSNDILAENIGADTVGPGWYAQKVLNTIQFKRAVQGIGIELIDGTDTIEIRQKVLTANLDLYVAHGNPDVAPDFSTLANALAYLDDIAIPPQYIATINIAVGVWNETALILIDHPDSSQIVIQGVSRVLTPTAVSCPNGQSIVTLSGPVGTFNGVAVGDYIGVQLGGGGYSTIQASGVWAVNTVAADGSSLTYSTAVTNWAGSFGTGPHTVYHLQTVLKWPVNVSGIRIAGSGLNLLQDIALVGVATSTASILGLSVIAGTVNCTRVGTYAWIASNFNGNGFRCYYAGYLSLNTCWACRCSDGAVFTADGNIAGLVSNANDRRGLWIQGCYVNSTSYWICGNKGEGIVIGVGSTFTFTAGYCARNQGGGFTIGNSTAAFSNGTNYWQENTNYDVILNVLASIMNSGNASIIYTNSNTAVRVLSPTGSYFSP
jgi:hypothetical protein